MKSSPLQPGKPLQRKDDFWEIVVLCWLLGFLGGMALGHVLAL